MGVKARRRLKGWIRAVWGLLGRALGLRSGYLPSYHEFAYSQWQAEPFDRVLRALGRRTQEKRSIGWPALTHGVDDVPEA